MALRDALTSDEVRSRIVAEGAETTASSPAAYAADIAAEVAKCSKIVRQLG